MCLAVLFGGGAVGLMEWWDVRRWDLRGCGIVRLCTGGELRSCVIDE